MQTPTPCEEFELQFPDALTGRLSGEEQRALDAHLAACTACQAQFATFKEAASAIDEAYPENEARTKQIWLRIEKSMGWRKVGDKVSSENVASSTILGTTRTGASSREADRASTNARALAPEGSTLFRAKTDELSAERRRKDAESLHAKMFTWASLAAMLVLGVVAFTYSRSMPGAKPNDIAVNQNPPAPSTQQDFETPAVVQVKERDTESTSVALALTRKTGPVALFEPRSRTWRPLAAGERLAVGARVATSAEARAEFAFDGGTLKLDEHTEFVFGFIAGQPEAELVHGNLKLEGTADAHATASGWRVRSGNGWLDAHGANLEVEAPMPGLALARVLSGKASVSASAPKVEHPVAVDVAAGREVLLAGIAPEKELKALSTSLQARVEALRSAKGGLALQEGTRSNWDATLATAQTKAQAAIGTLVAKDAAGRDAEPLSIAKLDVRTRIHGAMAITEIDETFFNNTDQRLEGTFYFPLPPGAAISRFAMYVTDEQLVEGEVVERQHARMVFNSILNQRRDPALLEWMEGNQFRARIFPIAPKSPKRVIMQYTQLLPAFNDTRRYVLPLIGDLTKKGEIGALSINVSVESGDGSALREVSSPSYPETKIEGAGSPAVSASLTHKQRIPTADFVLSFASSRAAEVTSTLYGENGEAPYVLLGYQPRLDAALLSAFTPKPRDLLFVVETSGARTPQDRAAQERVLKAMLSGVGAYDRVAIATADVSIKDLTGEFLPSYSADVNAAIEKLAHRPSLGGLNLSDVILSSAKRFAALTDDSRTHAVIFIGSGIPALGTLDAGQLSKDGAEALKKGHAAFIAVGVGRTTDSLALSELARSGAGFFFPLRMDEGLDEAAFTLGLSLQTPLIESLALLADGLTDIYPQELPTLLPSQEVFIHARLKNPQAAQVACNLSGRAAGRGFEQDVVLRTPKDLAADPAVGRFWARARLDALLAQGDANARRDEIIALAKTWTLMSPYTSFLVLESDADYAKYDINRTLRRALWRATPAPAVVAVVKPVEEVRDAPAIAGMDAAPANDAKKQEPTGKASANDAELDHGKAPQIKKITEQKEQAEKGFSKDPKDLNAEENIYKRQKNIEDTQRGEAPTNGTGEAKATDEKAKQEKEKDLPGNAKPIEDADGKQANGAPKATDKNADRPGGDNKPEAPLAEKPLAGKPEAQPKPAAPAETTRNKADATDQPRSAQEPGKAKAQNEKLDKDGEENRKDNLDQAATKDEKDLQREPAKANQETDALSLRKKAAEVDKKVKEQDAAHEKAVLGRLIDESRALYDVGRYAEAEQMAKHVREMDPLNQEAQALEANANARKPETQERRQLQAELEALNRTQDDGEMQGQDDGKVAGANTDVVRKRDQWSNGVRTERIKREDDLVQANRNLDGNFFYDLNTKLANQGGFVYLPQGGALDPNAALHVNDFLEDNSRSQAQMAQPLMNGFAQEQSDQFQSKTQNEGNVTNGLRARDLKTATETLATQNARLELIAKGVPTEYFGPEGEAPAVALPDAKVLAVKPELDIAVLSIGSANGVKAGQRVTISRGDSYLANGQIEHVYPDMCLVRLILKKGEVQTGDEAKSSTRPNKPTANAPGLVGGKATANANGAVRDALKKSNADDSVDSRNTQRNADKVTKSPNGSGGGQGQPNREGSAEAHGQPPAPPAPAPVTPDAVQAPEKPHLEPNTAAGEVPLADDMTGKESVDKALKQQDLQAAQAVPKKTEEAASQLAKAPGNLSDNLRAGEFGRQATQEQKQQAAKGAIDRYRAAPQANATTEAAPLFGWSVIATPPEARRQVAAAKNVMEKGAPTQAPTAKEPLKPDPTPVPTAKPEPVTERLKEGEKKPEETPAVQPGADLLEEFWALITGKNVAFTPATIADRIAACEKKLAKNAADLDAHAERAAAVLAILHHPDAKLEAAQQQLCFDTLCEDAYQVFKSAQGGGRAGENLRTALGAAIALTPSQRLHVLELQPANSREYGDWLRLAALQPDTERGRADALDALHLALAAWQHTNPDTALPLSLADPALALALRIEKPPEAKPFLEAALQGAAGKDYKRLIEIGVREGQLGLREASAKHLLAALGLVEVKPETSGVRVSLFRGIANVSEGAATLKTLLDGVAHFGGAGPAAEALAQEFLARVAAEKDPKALEAVLATVTDPLLKGALLFRRAGLAATDTERGEFSIRAYVESGADPRYLEAAVDSYAAAKNPAKAIEIVEKQLQTGYAADWLWPKLAALYQSTGDAENALRALTQEVALRPREASPRLVLAEAFEQQNQLGEAIRNLEAACEFAPESADAHRKLLALAIKAKDQSARENVLLKMLSQNWLNQDGDLWGEAEKGIVALRKEYEAAGDGARALKLARDAEAARAKAVQIVLIWDTTGTDVDLHVTEPGEQHVSYQSRTSFRGGVLDHDVTTGLGPETYTLKQAVPGDYRVMVKYYSGGAPTHCTVTVTMNKDGMNERTQVFQVDLTMRGEEKEILKFTINPPPAVKK